MGNIVAIVGRPNVGKSTLFNRLTGTKTAIVDETAGVTRDRHYGKSEWGGVEFSVIDTGGYITNSDDVFEEEIRKQVIIAIEESDVILFLVDINSGITSTDEEVAQLLRKTKKPVIIVSNKVDSPDRFYEAQEFYKFGIGEVFAISAMNGSGTGDLLEEDVAAFPDKKEDDTEELPKFAIIGRPNAGKSSLLNSLMDEERHIVTPVAGTTRDAIYTRYNKYKHDFYLVDTAGIRKKGKVHENIEFYSVLRSIRAIENSDVCLLLIDATRGVEAQDMNILDIVLKNNKGIVLLVNKWDLVEKETNTAKEFEAEIRRRMAPFVDVPIIFTSATLKQRIHKVLETAVQVYQNRKQRIQTSSLNELMLQAIEDNPPPSNKGKFIKVKYVTQLPTLTPKFAFFCNLPQYVKDPYKRYLENKIREYFNFTGVPIQIFIRKK